MKKNYPRYIIKPTFIEIFKRISMINRIKIYDTEIDEYGWKIILNDGRYILYKLESKYLYSTIPNSFLKFILLPFFKDSKQTIREIANIKERTRNRKKKQNRGLKIRMKELMNCRKCNCSENLTIHHIKPYFRGGDNSFKNLDVLCRECHDELNILYAEEDQNEITYIQFIGKDYYI